jgi:hypothetical protein
MSGRNHDSVPKIISGFAESTRFMKLAFLAHILCKFNDIIRKLCCGLSCFLFCSHFGEEVCGGEPGCVVLPVVFIDMLKLSKIQLGISWREQVTCNEMMVISISTLC